MAVTAILDFQKKVQNFDGQSAAGADMHHHAKFNHIRSNGCRDMAI